MNKSALTAIIGLGGLLSATLALTALAPFPGLVFFFCLAPLPLFLIGLSLGLRPLYGAILVAILGVLLIGGPIVAGELFILSFLGPAFLVNRALLHRKKSSGRIVWYPSSLLLRDLTFISGAIMLLCFGSYWYLTQGEDLQGMIKNLLTSINPQVYPPDLEAILGIAISFLPGFMALSWTFIMFLNGILAQNLLVKAKRNLRPSPAFQDIEISKSFLISLGVSILLAMVGVGYVQLLGKNSALILAFPFFVSGLEIIHKWLHKTSYPVVAFVAFYGILLFFSWVAFLIMLLGILKPWIEKSTQSN